jgi:predicted outer membrane protein
MEKLQTLKQIMQTNKMAFDYNYTMMMAAYEQNKLMFHTFLNQSTDIPAEAKTAIEEWLQGYRKGCENLKKMTDDGYQTVEKSMSSTWK